MWLVRWFVEATGQAIFIRWCGFVGGDGRRSACGLAGCAFFENAAGDEVVPLAGFCAGFFVDVCVSFALGDFDRTFGAP